MTNFVHMQAALSAFIDEHQLFTQENKLLLAVSGGVDSMTLLYLLVESCHQVAVAHMNFGLRGGASDLDEALVKETCQDLDIPVFTKQVETKKYAEAHQASTQMAARDLRYQWFEQLIEKHNLDYIVTAHNADDNLETVLFNLTKGTGIRGLSGMQPKVKKLVRPLLFASKTEILDHARTQNIPWREDASNADSTYLRNKIRQEVIPVLKTINPALTPHFENTRLRLAGTEQVFMQQVERIREKNSKWTADVLYINQQWMTGQASDAVILSELLRPYGFTFSQSLEIVKATTHQSGKLFQSPSHWLNVDREQYVIKASSETEEVATVIIRDVGTYRWGGWEMTLEAHPLEAFNKNANSSEVLIDADKVEFPLTLRQWQAGDSFQPLGMRGARKKVSDFLVDRKVPVVEKSSVAVLASAANICWIVNHRLDDRFKVTPDTRRLLKITCQKSFDDGLIPM